MRICPTCRTAYPARGRATCQKDGTRLVDAEEYAAARHDPLLGKEIMGRFLVHERIGTGGMGTVYRAEQIGLDRPVALKVLKKELVSDRETVARFHREAKAMSVLVHPNTVRVFDFGEDDEGHLFLAMELLEGELLTAWAEREETPPIADVVETIREILRSLNEAHSKGLIHRDLKPDNIYLARVEGRARPVVKVLDFGIAKVFRGENKIDQLETQAGTVFGTPRYMSPEQAQGKPLDHRSDLYSVGVLLYQLLTGHPPFLDDDAVVVMAKHIRETPAAPHKVAPDRPIPRSLERVVMRALAKEPDQRFDNADAFEAALAACLPDLVGDGDRPSLVERTSGFVERTVTSVPVALALGGGLVLLAVLVAVVVVAVSGPGDAPIAGTTPALADIAAPAVREAAASTLVTLSSTPGGADIYRDDEHVGVTPHTFAIAPEQAILLTVRLAGHAPADVELNADAAPEHHVSLTLDERAGHDDLEDDASDPTPRPTGRRRGRRGTDEPSAETRPEQTSRPPGSPYERFD